MRVWSLGQENPLEKEMEAHCSILAWRIPWTEKPGWQQCTSDTRGRLNAIKNWYANVWVFVRGMGVWGSKGTNPQLLCSQKSLWLSYKSITLMYSKRHGVENQKGRKQDRLPGFLEASGLSLLLVKLNKSQQGKSGFLEVYQIFRPREICTQANYKTFYIYIYRSLAQSQMTY